jgi:peptide-methionine (S)-S-oxide reductase
MSGGTAASGAPALEIATLGGGCFWCTEAVLSELRGVTQVLPGYAGGTTPNPSYEQVCTGRTGHAEVAQVTFDPSMISFRDLLTVFLTTHDPTQLNRQGADVGTQYRSVILYHDERQKKAAETLIAQLESQHLWKGNIVTQVVPFTVFYPAEEYHRDYYRRNPYAGYCAAVIAPKVAKFRKQYADRLRREPAAPPSAH